MGASAAFLLIGQPISVGIMMGLAVRVVERTEEPLFPTIRQIVGVGIGCRLDREGRADSGVAVGILGD